MRGTVLRGGGIFPKALMFPIKLKITHKIPLGFVTWALMVGVTVGITSYLKATSELEGESLSKLVTVVESRKEALNDYLSLCIR